MLRSSGGTAATLAPATRKCSTDGRDVMIALDGGVEPGNIAELAHLGVNDFISGGSIFYHRPAAERVREFREAMP